MSLTTVSSASFFNIPRVFGLGRGPSPPPSPPRKQSSSPRKQSASPQKRTSSPRKQSSSPRKRPSSPARARRPASPPPTRARSPSRTRRSATTPTRPRRASLARGAPPPVPRLPPTTQSRQPARARSRSHSRVRNPSPRPPPPARRTRAASTISTLSSFISTHAPAPTEYDPPPPPSWTDSLRALGKSTKTGADRVGAWRVKVAAANTTESQQGSQAGSVVSGRAGTDVGSASGVGTNVSRAIGTDVGTGVTGTGVTGTRTGAESQSDLQSLSDEDIFALTQNIKNEEASRRPLISPITPLADLRAEFSPFPDVAGLGQAEYAGPNANVLRKVDWLQKHGGWTGIRRTRGDGDCFYRSLAFAYVEKIMTASEPGLAVATSLSHLESTLPLLEQAGFQKIVFEDFYECFAEVIQQIVPSNGKPPLTNQALLQKFQDPEISNSIVVFLRLLTSSYIRLSPEDDFTPFLFHPDTGEMIDVRTFVEMFVEATGREADHPQIMALSKALRVRIEVAYLDNSSGAPLADGTVRVDFVKFAPEGAEEDGTKPVILLYRPGHYDTLEEKVDG